MRRSCCLLIVFLLGDCGSHRAPRANVSLPKGRLLFLADRVVIDNDRWLIVNAEEPDERLLQALKDGLPRQVHGKTLIFCDKPGPAAILLIIHDQSEVVRMGADSDNPLVAGLVTGLSPPPLPGVVPSGILTAVDMTGVEKRVPHELLKWYMCDSRPDKQRRTIC